MNEISMSSHTKCWILAKDRYCQLMTDKDAKYRLAARQMLSAGQSALGQTEPPAMESEFTATDEKYEIVHYASELFKIVSEKVAAVIRSISRARRSPRSCRCIAVPSSADTISDTRCSMPTTSRCSTPASSWHSRSPISA